MKEFSVIIYPVKTGEYFTSYMHPLTKKRIREHFKNRLDALENKTKVEAKFKKTQLKDLVDLLVSDLLHLYMINVPNNNLGKYAKSYCADLAETFGEFKIEDLSSEILKVWLDQIQKENNLKDISVRKIKCDFDGFFKYLVEEEIISESPLTTIFYDKITPPISSRNILSEKDIKDLLLAIKDFSPGYLLPLIMMFAETGAKTTEVVDLTWKDVDLENKKVKFKQTPSSCERTLEISDELAQLLSKKKSKQGYVFLTYYGEPFTKGKVGRSITEFKVKSKHARDWCVSDFRHSLAVNSLSKGKSINQLQYILGHKNSQQTRDLYGEVAKKALVKNFTNPMDLGTATTS